MEMRNLRTRSKESMVREMLIMMLTTKSYFDTFLVDIQEGISEINNCPERTHKPSDYFLECQKRVPRDSLCHIGRGKCNRDVRVRLGDSGIEGYCWKQLPLRAYLEKTQRWIAIGAQASYDRQCRKRQSARGYRLYRLTASRGCTPNPWKSLYFVPIRTKNDLNQADTSPESSGGVVCLSPAVQKTSSNNPQI